jgi:1-acyl-sn-glycerol-3-phosphate acyltransferase
MNPQRFQSLGVLEALRDFHLPPVPYMQIFLARVFIGINFRLPGRATVVSIEGLEHLEGDEPMMIAMNHTDRFNYAPFMRELDQRGFTPLAPWVKGKYYQNPWMSRLLCWSACMPVPSRGFLLTLDWLARTGRQPDETEYRQLRVLGDGTWDGGDLTDQVTAYLELAPGGGPEGFFSAFQGHFEGLSGEVVRINKESMELGYRPLVFPQGTRSRRLTRGFSGVVQMALHTGVKIVPVGVCGSDDAYPGDSPLSVGGHVRYVVGAPFDPAVGREGVPRDFVPLTIRASQDHGPRFEDITDDLMNRINELLPPEYQFAPEQAEGARGAERFL